MRGTNIMFWKGNYSFFDWKYAIEGYQGQDYDGPASKFYMIISIILIIVCLIVFRKTKQTAVKNVIKYMGIFMLVLSVSKITWESYHDIKYGDGFNAGGILPFDTCSIFTYLLLIAGFTKKERFINRCSVVWLATIGFAGGVSNLLFCRGLKYYPFFTFGGFFSMIWHALMVFMAFYIPITFYHKFKWTDGFLSMIPMLAFSLIVIPLDYIKNWDYMLLKEAGGVPFIEDVCDKLIDKGLGFLCTLLMLVLYLAASFLMVSIHIGYQKAVGKKKKECLLPRE